MSNENMSKTSATDDANFDAEELKSLVSESIGVAEKGLSRNAPDVLANLRRKDQEDLAEAETQDERITLGERRVASDSSTADWRKGARYIESELKARVELCGPKLDEIRRSLLIGERWQLFADIIAVVGPASIFAVLKVEFPRTAQYMSAAFALAALIVATIARRTTKSPIRNATYQSYYRQLVEQREEAADAIRQLRSNLRCGKITRELVDLLRRANETCRRLGELLD